MITIRLLSIAIQYSRRLALELKRIQLKYLQVMTNVWSAMNAQRFTSCFGLICRKDPSTTSQASTNTSCLSTLETLIKLCWVLSASKLNIFHFIRKWTHRTMIRTANTEKGRSGMILQQLRYSGYSRSATYEESVKTRKLFFFGMN